MLRARLAVGPTGPGRAGVGVDWAPGSAPRDDVRRALLTAGLTAVAAVLPAVHEPERTELLRELSDLGPAEVLDLTAVRRRDGLELDPAPLMVDAARPSALRAEVLVGAGEDPEDALVRLGRPQGPAALPPATLAMLVPVALARAMPRDLEALARLGIGLRALAREAGTYPQTLMDMVPGIAATARDPERVREFGRLAPDPVPGAALPGRPADTRRPPPSPRRMAAAAVAGAGLLAAGIAVAEVAWRVLDPARAVHGTVLVAGALAGALAGAIAAARILRRG